ncbi:MAG: DUF6476 family protein [Ahrensia sp.]|nr:DUF6476 family protein [Ahrensia sp.]
MKDQDKEEPLDPQVEAIRRKMMRLLMISSGTMILGLMAVLIAIVYRVTQAADAVPEAAMHNEITLPQGATILHTALDGGRILLTVRHADGTREIRLHNADGKLSATYTINEG